MPVRPYRRAAILANASNSFPATAAMPDSRLDSGAAIMRRAGLAYELQACSASETLAKPHARSDA